MLILSLLVSALGNFLKSSSGDYLSPFTISSTLSWQIRSIELNSNHLDYFDTLFLYFSVEDLPLSLSSLITEISLPEDLTPTICSVKKIDESLPDWMAICSYSVETSGSYGPLGLKIRAAESGQIIAEDKNFGYFYVDENMIEEDDGTLTIMYSGESTSRISETISLNFTFELSDLQWVFPEDYFILNIADDFTYHELDFIWLGYQSSSNIPKPILIPDKYDDKLLYIYGIGAEIKSSNGFNISFELSGFINPSYQKTGGNYNWSLRIFRYSTPTVYRFVKGTGPDVDIIAGKITVSSWLPKNSAIKSFIVEGLTTFTVLSFKTQNEVPYDGILTVEVSGAVFCDKSFQTDSKQVPADAADKEECSLRVTCGRYALDCTVTDSASASKVECIAYESIPGGSSFNLVALTTFKASVVSVISISIKTDSHYLIDELQDSFSPKLTPVGLLVVNQHYVAKSFDNTDGVNALAASGTYGIVLAFESPVDLQAGDSFSLYMPVSTSSSRTSLSVAVTSSYFSIYDIDTDLDFNTFDKNSASQASSNKVIVGTNTISFTLEFSATIGKGIVFYIGAGSKSSPNPIFMPLAKTLLSDMSESVLVLKKSNMNYIFAQPFSVDVNTADLDFKLLPFCNNVFQKGMPLKITISLPFDYNIGSLLVYINFDDDLSAGTMLEDGHVYPSHNLKAEFTDEGGLRLTFLKFSSNSEEWLIFAYPDNVQDLSSSISVNLIRDFQEVEVFSKVFTTPSGSSEVSFVENGQKSINVQGQDQVTFTLPANNHDGTVATSLTMGYAYLIPRGFAFSKGTENLLGHDSQHHVARASYGSLTVNELLANTFSQTLTAPWFTVNELQYLILVLTAGASFSSTTCAYGFKQPYSVSDSLTMTYKSFSPTRQKGYSFGSIFTNLNLKLTVPGYVASKSYIKVTLSDDWSSLFVDDEWMWVILGDRRFKGSFENSVWTSEMIKTQTSGTSTTLEVNVLVKLPEVTNDESFESYVGFSSVYVFYEGLLDVTPESFQWVQADHDSQGKVKTKFSAGSMTAAKSNVKVLAFPDVKGSKSVFLKVWFKVNQLLLAGSLITVDAGLALDSDSSLNTWCNFLFESAVVSSGVLSLNILDDIQAGAEIVIVKDYAFDLDKEGIRNVMVSVQVDGKTVVDDFTNPATTQGFTVKSSPYVKVSKFSIIPEVTNAATDSWHTVSVTLNETLKSDLFIHLQFNKDFNSMLGPTYSFEDVPDTSFIEAYSSSGSLVLCEVFHWCLSCYLGSLDSPSILFRLRLLNPSSSGKLSVFFTDSSGEVIVQPYYQPLEDIFSFNTSYQSLVDVYYVEINENVQDKGLTHSVYLYISSDILLNKSSVFIIDFPLPYDLSSTSSSKTKCSILSRNITSSKDSYLFSSSPCSIQDNSVLIMPGLSAFSINRLNWTIFAIEGLYTPTEEKAENLFKLNDSVWFYTRNFRVALSSVQISETSSQLTIRSVSFANLHATFAGFKLNPNEQVIINEGEKLVIAPGTFSGIFKVSTGDSLKSKKLTLKGKPRDDAIQIVGNLTLTSDLPFAEFWVGVSSGTPSGFYYIDWELEEEAYGKSLYKAPKPTLVEIDSSLSYDLEFSYSLIVPPDYFSIPYPVSIVSSKRTVSPFEDLEIVFFHDLDVNIVFSPSTLVISSKETFASLQIFCANCSTGTVYQFRASLNGSSAFRLNEEQQFEFDYPYEEPANIQVQVKDLTSNSFEVELFSDSFALVTWCLAGQDVFDPFLVSEEYLLNNVKSLSENKGFYGSLDEQVEEYYSKLYELLENAESYDDFALEAWTSSRKLYLINQDLTPESETKTIAKFEQLTPNSTYYFYMFVDNYSGYSSVTFNTIITTEVLPSHGQVQLADFLETSDLKAKMSEVLHIDAYRIVTSSDTRRRLQVSKSFTVLSSMTSETSGYELISQVTKEELETALDTEILTISALNPQDMLGGDWAYDPLWTVDDQFLWINFTSVVDGKIHCQVEVDPNANYSQITEQQILFKVDRTGDVNYENYYNLNVEALNNSSMFFNVSGYEGVMVVVSCIVCNEYPLMPNCSEVKNFTYEEEDLSSFAEVLMISYFLAFS